MVFFSVTKGKDRREGGGIPADLEGALGQGPFAEAIYSGVSVRIRLLVGDAPICKSHSVAGDGLGCFHPTSI